MTDNEPVNLVHTEITGLWARNPRTGASARRAIVMIDPFAGQRPPAADPDNLLSLGIGLVNALLDQSRMSTSNLSLALDPDCFSRFLLGPGIVADALGGPNAQLASAAGHAFSGFLGRDRLIHDFRLGRYNGYLFLKDHFGLPAENKLLRLDEGSALQGQTFPDPDRNDRMLVRLVPLVEGLKLPHPPDPPPPVTEADIDRNALEARFSLVFDHLIRLAADGVSLAWLPYVAPLIRGHVVKIAVAKFAAFIASP
jgi:hypothetical protein